MIHAVSSKIEQEIMSTLTHEVGIPNEYEVNPHIWKSTIEILRGYVRKFLSNNCLRIKSWRQKSNQIFNLHHSSAFF